MGFSMFQSPELRLQAQLAFHRKEVEAAPRPKGKEKSFSTKGSSAYLAIILALVQSMDTANLTQNAAAGQLSMSTKREGEISDKLDQLNKEAAAIHNDTSVSPQQTLAEIASLQVEGQQLENKLSVEGAKQGALTQTLIDGTSTQQQVAHNDATKWTEFVQTFATARSRG